MTNFNNLSLPQDRFGGVLPPTIASDSVIRPNSVISFVSGTTQLATIVPPVDGQHQIVLIFTNSTPGQFLTSGNIALAITPVQYASVILMYDPISKVYYPISVSSGSSGSSIVHQSYIEVNNAAILAITDPGTLPELITAPGANLATIPLQAVLYFNGTTGYTLPSNTGLLTIVYGEYDEDCFTKLNAQGFLTVGAVQEITFLTPLMSAPRAGSESNIFWGLVRTPSSIINKPLKLYAESPSPFTWTGGNAANKLQISITYLTLNTSTGLFV